MIRNTANGFGVLTRILHWATAALVLAALALGWSLERMEPGLALITWYAAHKTLGAAILILTALRLVWHRLSPPPPPQGDAAAWPQRAARAVHLGFYLCLLAMPIAGWVGASASGLPVQLLGGVTLPPLAPVSEAWEEAAFGAHAALGVALGLLVTLHLGGVAVRLAKRDGTLGRMVSGR